MEELNNPKLTGGTENNGAELTDSFNRAGEPYVHTEPMDQVWRKVNLKDRIKLRAAYPLGVMAGAIAKDLAKHKWLNLAFVGVSLIPGPGGILFFPGLLLSYGVRWDEHAKVTRRKLWNLVKHDVPLARYRHIIKPNIFDEGRYYVDSKALMKHTFDILKHGATKIKQAAERNFPHAYNRFISAPLLRLGNWVQKPLGRVIGKARAESTISSIFNAKARMEVCTKKVASWTNARLEGLANWTGSQIKSTFNAVASCKQNLGEKLYNGWEYNRKAIKNLFSPRPKP